MEGNESRSAIPEEILHLDYQPNIGDSNPIEEISHPEHHDQETARIITKGRVAAAIAGIAVVSASVVAARHFRSK